MDVIAFAASSSKQSINKSLAFYAACMVKGGNVDLLDLNDYELPLFSVDREEELGQPQLAKDFLAKLENSDAIIISFAEHNGNYSAAYKNLFDWCSRIEGKLFFEKPMILLATSPGGRGATTVLELAAGSIPRFGGDVRASMSVPNFYDNFDIERGVIINDELNDQLIEAVNLLSK